MRIWPLEDPLGCLGLIFCDVMEQNREPVAVGLPTVSLCGLYHIKKPSASYLKCTMADGTVQARQATQRAMTGKIAACWRGCGIWG